MPARTRIKTTTRLQQEREIRLQRCRESRLPTSYTRGGLELGELPYQSTDCRQTTLQRMRACSCSPHNALHSPSTLSMLKQTASAHRNISQQLLYRVVLQSHSHIYIVITVTTVGQWSMVKAVQKGVVNGQIASETVKGRLQCGTDRHIRTKSKSNSLQLTSRKLK